MTNEELEREIGHLATKEDVALLRGDTKAALAELETSLLKQIIASERSIRSWILAAYGAIGGTYALIIAGIFINHFWK